ncbi:MAG: acetate--CoA ligase family protein [Thermoplasmata archaeon]
MDFLFNPRSVAVVGASNKEGKIGYEIMNSLIASRDRIKIYPVNPNEREIFSLKSYPNVSSIPESVDLMVISLQAQNIPDVIEEGAVKGVKGAIIISGGFGELGDEGKLLEKRISEISDRYGIRVVGPNCIGVFSSRSKFDTFFQARDAMKRPGDGPVAFMTQSGTYGVTLLELMEKHHIGVSKFISFGNKVDINEIDMLEYFMSDNDTKIISGYLESFRDGRKFFEMSREVSLEKPVIILKAGKTREGQIAAKSHTGALAENYSVYEGAMKQSGVITVDDIEDMVDIIKILAKQPLPSGGKILMITNGAGPCVVTADEIGRSRKLKLANLDDDEKEEIKKILPDFAIVSNPLDLTGSATPEWYMDVMEKIKNSKNVDIFVLYFVIPNAPIYRNIHKLYELFSKNWNRPVIAVMSGGSFTEDVSDNLEKMNIPVITTARRLVNALEKIVEYSEWKSNSH